MTAPMYSEFITNVFVYQYLQNVYPFLAELFRMKTRVAYTTPSLLKVFKSFENLMENPFSESMVINGRKRKKANIEICQSETSSDRESPVTPIFTCVPTSADESSSSSSGSSEAVRRRRMRKINQEEYRKIHAELLKGNKGAAGSTVSKKQLERDKRRLEVPIRIKKKHLLNENLNDDKSRQQWKEKLNSLKAKKLLGISDQDKEDQQMEASTSWADTEKIRRSQRKGSDNQRK